MWSPRRSAASNCGRVALTSPYSISPCSSNQSIPERTSTRVAPGAPESLALRLHVPTRLQQFPRHSRHRLGGDAPGRRACSGERASTPAPAIRSRAASSAVASRSTYTRSSGIQKPTAGAPGVHPSPTVVGNQVSLKRLLSQDSSRCCVMRRPRRGSTRRSSNRSPSSISSGGTTGDSSSFGQHRVAVAVREGNTFLSAELLYPGKPAARIEPRKLPAGQNEPAVQISVGSPSGMRSSPRRSEPSMLHWSRSSCRRSSHSFQGSPASQASGRNSSGSGKCRQPARLRDQGDHFKSKRRGQRLMRGRRSIRSTSS